MFLENCVDIREVFFYQIYKVEHRGTYINPYNWKNFFSVTGWKDIAMLTSEQNIKFSDEK